LPLNQVTPLHHSLRGACKNLPISRKKSRTMPPVFINKLTKTFMDAIYAFLDGLVLLTTEDSPSMKEPDKVKLSEGNRTRDEVA
jgi:hypothetical protein